MDYSNSLLLTILCSIIVVVAEECYTPLGRPSECVNLFNCPQLLRAFQQRSLTSNVIAFLKKSHCGYEDDLPKVCCGPLSVENNPSITSHQSDYATAQPSYGIEAKYDEDSLPAPADKCGYDTEGGITDKILGGESTYLDEFPWMALLGYQSESGRVSYKCGGALINHRYVLTAAHCLTGAVERLIGKVVTVRLGEYNTQTDRDCIDDLCADPPQEIPVHSVYPHPGFGDTNINRKDDIGLIRLSRRVKYTDYVQPICLADSDAQIVAGSEVYVAGWGQTLSGRSSAVKQKLNFTVFDKTKCDEKYRTKGADLTDKQICTGETAGKGACKGDSGGPIMRRRSEDIWESIGIVSFGYGCGIQGWPGVTTSVAGYSDWIRSVLKFTNV